MFGEGDIFHSYEYVWEIYANLYDKMAIQKEEIVPVWINASDIETDLIDWWYAFELQETKQVSVTIIKTPS